MRKNAEDMRQLTTQSIIGRGDDAVYNILSKIEKAATQCQFSIIVENSQITYDVGEVLRALGFYVEIRGDGKTVLISWESD